MWLAVATALAALFLTILAYRSSSGESTAVLAGINVTIAMATIFVAAACAVFGPGSYLKRLLWTHFFVAVVGLGYLAGMLATVSSSVWNNSLNDLTLVKIFLLGIAPVSLAAQLPFWFFRCFLGWQFTFGSSPPADSFSLRDIFVFTFLAAISFAGPQVAANQIVVLDNYDVTVNLETVTQPDGTVTWENVPITDQQEIDERLRRRKREIRNAILLGYFVTAAWAFTISLLSFPALLCIFRPKEPGFGCGLMMAYVAAWCFLLFTIASVVGGSPPGEAIIYSALFMFAYGGLISIPFAQYRNRGFRLTSHRRHRKENLVARPKAGKAANASDGLGD